MTTTAAHLWTVAAHWADLNDALTTHNTAWPPAGRADILRALDELDATEAAHLRADGTPLRTVAAPLDLTVLDLMDLVRTDLADCAAAVAEHVQRAPMPMPPRRRAATARTRAERVAWNDHARRVHAAQADAADPRRWKWTGRRPDAPYAALWLLGRVQRAPGPFRPLGDPQHRHIATVARTAASRVEQALDITGQVAHLALPCPDCGGGVDLHGGSGTVPTAHCNACGKTWSEKGLVAAA